MPVWGPNKEFITPLVEYKDRYSDAFATYDGSANRIVFFKRCLDIYMKGNGNGTPGINPDLTFIVAHEIGHAIARQFYNKDKLDVNYSLYWLDKIDEGVANLIGTYVTQAISTRSKSDLLTSALSMLDETSKNAKAAWQNFSNDILKLKLLETTGDTEAIAKEAKNIILNILDMMEIISLYYRPTLGLIQVIIENRGKSLPKILEKVFEEPAKFDSLKKNLDYQPINIKKISKNASPDVETLMGLYKQQHDAEKMAKSRSSEDCAVQLSVTRKKEESILQKMSQEQKKELAAKCIEALEYAKNEWLKIDNLAKEMSKRIEELSLSSSKTQEMYNIMKKLLRMH